MYYVYRSICGSSWSAIIRKYLPLFIEAGTSGVVRTAIFFLLETNIAQMSSDKKSISYFGLGSLKLTSWE